MRSTFDAVARNATEAPQKIALISDGGEIRTYQQLIAGATNFGEWLRVSCCLAPGDRVAIWSFNRCDWAEASLGCSAMGYVPVPLNPEWTNDEASFAMRRSKARVLMCEPGLESRAQAISEFCGLVAFGALGNSDCGFTAAGQMATAIAVPALPQDAGAVLAFTSGTTAAKSKAVVKSSYGSSRNSVDFRTLWGLSNADRTLITTPFFHGNGWSGTISALMLGGSVVFQRRFSASGFWPLVDKYRPTFFFTLAPIVNILLSLPPSSVERAHSLRFVLSLGSALDRQNIETRWAVRVLDWYGATEMGGVACGMLDDEPPHGAIGKIMPGVRLKVLREDGSECSTGETGELAIPCEDIGFIGYLDDKAATDAAVRNGLFHSGDLGYVDDDGYLYFVDRLKDIVRRGGENISGLEVEAVLREHPAVGDVAVVALPDPVLGERVAVLVIPAAGSDGPTLEDLREYASHHLAHFKLPEMLRTVESLPRTTNGKVRKAEARAVFAAADRVNR